MKTKFLFIILIISFVGLIAQQKESTKFQTADESGFIEVDKAPALISQLKPAYPELAKLAGIEGKVFLKLLIDENGNVEKAKVEKSVKDMLDEAALTAAKSAKFSPALLNDKPVKVWVVLPIAFKLEADKKTEARILKYSELEPLQSDRKSEDPDINDFVKVEKFPQLIESAKPDYPEFAKQSRITGRVFVKVLVDKEGIPKKAVVVKSDSEFLNQSAIDAAMKSKFSPAMKDNKPIEVWIVLPYKFALEEGKKEEKK